jgi:hexokinase
MDLNVENVRVLSVSYGGVEFNLHSVTLRDDHKFKVSEKNIWISEAASQRKLHNAKSFLLFAIN